MTTDLADGVLEQLGRGEVRAIDKLVEAYGPYLRAVVSARLSDRLRAKFDSVDVVQSVWVQVIRQLGRDGWRVNDADHLRASLATLARRRLATLARRCAREKVGPGAANDGLAAVTDTRTRPPGEAAEADDAWSRLYDLTPPEYRPILLLRREGLTPVEIADRTGLHEGSVRRILRQLSRQLAVGALDDG